MSVTLRPVTSDDAETLWRWAQDRDLNVMTGAWKEPPTLDFIQRMVAGWGVETRAYMIVVDGTPVGNCWLGHIHDGSATLGIAIAEPAYRDQGYGTEVMRLLLAEGLRVTLWVYADNERAAAVYRKVGFTETGRSDAMVGPSSRWRTS